jgi:hypothetical protein
MTEIQKIKEPADNKLVSSPEMLLPTCQAAPTEHRSRQCVLYNMDTVHSLMSLLLLSIMCMFVYAQNDNSDRVHNHQFQLPPFNAAQKGRQGRRSGRLRETEATEGSSSPNLHFQKTTTNDSVVRVLKSILCFMLIH